ncbi:cadherin domain-containing protein [Rhodobium gokarnense]|uniref:Ca2+-binding RTX toxin-like protein n=1 Tax=Rhodobium gokarnense TaxID=364296 RepID=A0ABT3HFT7_9HYPH|nr:cadherin domain-containing protein [Rhodobium gokarnense]MCW2309263.1 Ca2+-binding RTX toxin-like protein [Rhodobium gokarnense]
MVDAAFFGWSTVDFKGLAVHSIRRSVYRESRHLFLQPGGDGTMAITGTNGADTLNGTDSSEVISGLGGGDRINARGGADTVSGGDGHDTIFGGDGADSLNGGNGRDSIYGGDGHDFINGGTGSDSLYGGEGRDTIWGGDQGDYIDGGGWADSLVGGQGNDTIYGGDGADTLAGGDQDDELHGGNGNDHVIGGNGNDFVAGGEGHDTVTGSTGNDSVYGNNGNDNLQGGDGNDVVLGGDGDDVVIGNGDDDYVQGNAGNDTVRGDEGNDTVRGGDGDDVLDGGTGNDTLYGDGGNDSISGGDGADTVVFTGTWADYDITVNPDGSYTISDTRAGSPDGVDTVYGDVETFAFSDGQGGVVRIAYADVPNDAPADIAWETGGGTIAEDAAVGDIVGTVAASDADSGIPSETISYAITAGNEDGLFEIDAATGIVTVAAGASFDFETTPSYALTVAVSDAHGATSSQTLTIAIGDVNEAPDSLGVSPTSVDENSAAGTVVGTASATDPDAGDSLTYSLVDDAGGALAIDATTGEITVADPSLLDYEAESALDITVRATDSAGLYLDADQVITLNDVNEAPESLEVSPNSVDENSAAGTVVGTASATDPDAGDSLTYSLVDDAGGAFAIDAATGEITVADRSLLDYETRTSLDILVRATDSGGLYQESTETIAINDVNEAPDSLTVSLSTIDENSAAGTIVGTVSATDPDAGDSLTYSLVDDAGGAFAIDAATGLITVANALLLDYETASALNITVRATDSGGLHLQSPAAVTLRDVVGESVTGSVGDDSIAGGDGNDTLDGAAGNDTLVGGNDDDDLTGGAGDDNLAGSLGSDTFVYSAAGFGHDTVTDFVAGAGTDDAIEFSTGLFADFNAVLAAASDDGTDTTITLDVDNTIVLQDVVVNDLNQDDFLFV